MFKTIVLTLGLILIAQSSGELVCPSDEVMYPCDCVESFSWIRCNGANVTSGEQIREVLQRISPLIDEDVVFSKLWITDTPLKEIPAGVIQSLKFEQMQISSNDDLIYISPDAFNGTQNVTKEIILRWNNFSQNGSSTTDWVFEFLNTFSNVSRIELDDIGLMSIPDNAFGYLPKLERIEIRVNAIKTVGNYVFSNLPMLNTAWITNDRALTNESFSPNSFKNFSSPDVWVGFDWSDSLHYLPEESIKPIFDTGRRLTVGGATCTWPISCTYRRLICDSNIDWICNHPYRNILEGYYCRDSIHDKIEGYCASLKTVD